MDADSLSCALADPRAAAPAWVSVGALWACGHSLTHTRARCIGALFSSMFAKLWGEKEMRILILGLDGAGKTTILYRLQVWWVCGYVLCCFSWFSVQVGEVVTTIPSMFRAMWERAVSCEITVLTLQPLGSTWSP